MTLAGLSIVAISFIPAGTENTGNKETISVLIMREHQQEQPRSQGLFPGTPPPSQGKEVATGGGRGVGGGLRH